MENLDKYQDDDTVKIVRIGHVSHCPVKAIHFLTLEVRTISLPESVIPRIKKDNKIPCAVPSNGAIHM
jgi:hypothetical protein